MGDMMNLPVRKQVRLKEYDYSQNGAYFVTVCTHERAQLFGRIDVNTDDAVGSHLCVRPNPAYEIANKWLLEIECKYQGVTVSNHIIMPNHVHFILLINSTADAHIGATPSETVKSSGAPLRKPLKKPPPKNSQTDIVAFKVQKFHFMFIQNDNVVIGW